MIKKHYKGSTKLEVDPFNEYTVLWFSYTKRRKYIVRNNREKSQQTPQKCKKVEEVTVNNFIPSNSRT